MSGPESQLRDELAVERTHLANERTLLAYVRTALGLVAAGAALIRFVSDERLTLTAGWILVAGGTLLGVFGGLRFGAVRRKLKSSEP